MAASLAFASPASADAVCTGPATTYHKISIKCSGSVSGKTQFRVAAEFCTGTTQGCTTRYGAWVNIGSSSYSTAQDNSLYFTGYYSLPMR